MAGRGGPAYTPNRGKQLPLQAILFDWEVLTIVHDHDEEEYQEARREVQRRTGIGKHEIRRVEELVQQKDASLLLKGELRDELKKRGLDSAGKPWVMQARLQEVFNKEKLSDMGLGFGSTPKSSSTGTSQTGGTAAGQDTDDVRAKYMAKLQEKKARMAQRAQGKGGQDGGDGADLFGQGDSDGSGQWNQNRGTNKLLGYLQARGMRAALVLPPKGHAMYPVGADAVKKFQSQFDLDLTPVLSAEDGAKIVEASPAPMVMIIVGTTL